MIGYLSGTLLSREDSSVIINVSGVGYQVLMAKRVADRLKIGSPCELFIHTHVRENVLELFGFESAFEKRTFLLLTSVSGVGPRTAMAILSGLDSQSILKAITQEDAASLSSAPGVGKKTADRLIMELKAKARELLGEGNLNSMSHSSTSIPEDCKQALSALVSLGYNEQIAANVIRRAIEAFEKTGASVSVDKLIMNSLQLISKGDSTL